MSAIVAYIPVLHKGYLDLFARHPDARELYIIGEDILADFDHVIRKDIRRVPPEQMKSAIEALNLFDKVEILDKNLATSLGADGAKLVMAEDEITKDLVAHLESRAPSKLEIVWDKAFLRWHRDNTLEEQSTDPDETISTEEADRELMSKAKELGSTSWDWYRQVGAFLVRDGEVMLATVNTHMPSEQQAYTVGDPRSIFKRNLNIEISSAIHCEAGLIAEAARRGIKTEGLSVYVTDFPCPPCAKVLSRSGISKLYYSTGYAVLDGGAILKDAGIKLVHVK